MTVLCGIACTRIINHRTMIYLHTWGWQGEFEVASTSTHSLPRSATSFASTIPKLVWGGEWRGMHFLRHPHRARLPWHQSRQDGILTTIFARMKLSVVSIASLGAECTQSLMPTITLPKPKPKPKPIPTFIPTPTPSMPIYKPLEVRGAVHVKCIHDWGGPPRGTFSQLFSFFIAETAEKNWVL